MTNIHVKIKCLRSKNDYKQKQVAEYLGISQQTYSCYELDKRELPSRHAIGLARLYHVSTDYIFDIEPESTGSHSLNAEFTPDVTFRDILISLRKLNPGNRAEIHRVLTYLIRSQSGGQRK